MYASSWSDIHVYVSSWSYVNHISHDIDDIINGNNEMSLIIIPHNSLYMNYLSSTLEMIFML